MVLVAIQLSVAGSYRPPVLKSWRSDPPQTIISLPVQTAVCSARASGALVVLVAVQLSVVGSYLPPVLQMRPPLLLRPRRSFHCRSKPRCERIALSGALVVLVAVQLSVPGLYLPPLFKQSVRYRCRLRPRRSFHCQSRLPCDTSRRFGRIGGAGGCPTIRKGIVSPAGVQNGRPLVAILRPRRSFHCRSRLRCEGIVLRARW